MQTFILFLKLLFGIFFCFAGVMHLIKPKFFKNFIPNFLPKLIVNYVTGIIEILFGLGLFFPDTTKNAAMGVFAILIIFTPIHIWDATKIQPAIGSKKIAYFRIPLQFLLLYLTYIIYMNS